MIKLLRLSSLVVFCLLSLAACRQSTSEQISEQYHQRSTTLDDASIVVPEPVANLIADFQMPDRIHRKLTADGPQPQPFTANASEQFTVICEQGSVLNFPAGVFVYADSKEPVEGEIEITVTEYLDHASILFAGLTTNSGKDIIETGGMLYIDATSNGRKCEIREGEFYEIGIPSDVEKENMELFYGQGTDGRNINWLAANRGGFMANQTNKSFLGKELVAPVKSQASYDGGIKAMYEYLHTKVELPDWTKDIQLKAICYVNFMLDYEGEVKKVSTSPYIKTYGDKEIATAFREMQCWRVSDRIKKGDAVRMIVPVRLDWVKDPKQIPYKVHINNRADSTKFNATYETDKYLLASQQLGWVNCDRFYQNKKPRTEFFVKVDSTYDATVRIVFTNYKSVIGGVRFTKGFLFRDVPIGEEITIVAMRNNNGRYELAMKDCLLTALPVNDLQFVPVSREEMMEKFNELGRSTAGNTANAQQQYINPIEELLLL